MPRSPPAIVSTSRSSVASASFSISATTCRSRSTAMRSLSRSTSSSSAEMNSTDMPSSQSDSTSRWISAFAPTSMPRVGSSRISSRGSVISQRASRTFCWLPPLRCPTTAFGIGRADVERLDLLGDQLVLPPAGDRPRPAAAGLQREDDVLAHGQLVDEALGAPVLGAEGDAARSSSSAGCASTPCSPSMSSRPESAWSAPKRSRASSVRPEPSRPARPTTSPWRDGEVERRDRAACGRDRLRLDHRRRAGPLATFATRLPFELLERLELPAEHLRDELRPAGARSSCHSPTSWPLRRTVIRSEIS